MIFFLHLSAHSVLDNKELKFGDGVPTSANVLTGTPVSVDKERIELYGLFWFKGLGKKKKIIQCQEKLSRENFMCFD